MMSTQSNIQQHTDAASRRRAVIDLRAASREHTENRVIKNRGNELSKVAADRQPELDARLSSAISHAEAVLPKRSVAFARSAGHMEAYENLAIM